jgi:uncharacterized SAM-binding protein YcdF (DUF218 family)
MLGLMLAALLYWRGWRRTALATAAASFGWLWLWSMPITSRVLNQNLQAEYPGLRAGQMPAAEAIVVLGGGFAAPNATRPYPDLSDAGDRVWHAARLYHAGKAPLVLASGGSASRRNPLGEAHAMRLFLHDLGVPDAAIVLEDRSLSTRQNARFSALLLRQRGISRILLVTSATHMPRALELFEAEGLQVVPAATDHTGSEVRDGWMAWVPNTGALESSTGALKEYLGRWGRRLGF